MKDEAKFQVKQGQHGMPGASEPFTINFATVLAKTLAAKRPCVRSVPTVMEQPLGGGGGRVCEWGVPPPARSAEPPMVCEVSSAQHGVIQWQIGSRLFFHRESNFCYEACN